MGTRSREAALASALAVGAALVLGAPARAPAEGAGAPAAVASTPRLDLPPELERYRGELQPTVKPFVRVRGTPGATKPWESKFGGSPYLPRGAAVPRDAKGKPMRLLAQINFAEVPDAGMFPRKGILQFFLSASDEVYGLDFQDPTRQRNYRIVYYADVTQDPARLAAAPAVPAKRDVFPLEREARLSFSLQWEPASLEDHRADALLPGLVHAPDGVQESYQERFPPGGHKLGGYPAFTQQDPRSEGRPDYDVLLLQIDSDDDLGIMWGDVGVANFFIRAEDLRRRSFADVLYNWDCS